MNKKKFIWKKNSSNEIVQMEKNRSNEIKNRLNGLKNSSNGQKKIG